MYTHTKHGGFHVDSVLSDVHETKIGLLANIASNNMPDMHKHVPRGEGGVCTHTFKHGRVNVDLV
jgi:hypothetical protein